MTPEHSDSPIECFLDELVEELAAESPRELRRLVAETEAHLRDDAEAAVAAGASADEAERYAVQRFGSARELAGGERNRLSPHPPVLRQVAYSGLLLAGVGGLAVGASGLVAAGIRAVGGSRVVVDAPLSRALAGSDCARWLAADPGARTCRDAAIADWAAETVFYRIGLGIVGLACVLLYHWLRRRSGHRGGPAALPPLVTDAVATALFGAAALGTLALGLHAVISSGGNGSGQWLSAGLVALVAAGVFGLRLLTDLRTPTPQARSVAA
jgi:hypothetical protein